MKKSKNIFKAFCKNISTEIAANMSLIEVHSNFEMYICGCISIIEYSETKIVLETVSGVISIFGKLLLIEVFHSDTLTVSGEIETISLGEFND